MAKMNGKDEMEVLPFDRFKKAQRDFEKASDGLDQELEAFKKLYHDSFGKKSPLHGFGVVGKTIKES